MSGIYIKFKPDKVCIRDQLRRVTRHIVSKEGIAVDMDKVKAIMQRY